ncbi:MAG: hypothetical protein AABX54_00510, partial [Nanoarchaeota archaeon]
MALKIFLITLILILLVINTSTYGLIYAAESSKDTRTVKNFLSNDAAEQDKKLDEFMALDGETRNQILKNSDFEKNTLADKIARKISERVYRGALRDENAKKVLNALGPASLAQINSLNLIKIQDYEALKKILQKAGVDLNPKNLNKLERGSLDGFESSDLSWTTQKDKDGKSLNVIGNSQAGVWLNLEDIPMETKKMEYDSGKKQFVLTMRNGAKVIIGKNTIDSKGQFNAFLRVNMEGIGKSFSKDPNFKFDLKNLDVKSGNVLFGDDKIELKGETQVNFGEFTFGRKKDESSSTSIIKFDGNKIMLTGTEMRYDNAEKIGSTTTPFMYIQGDYKEEAVKVTSFDDIIKGYVKDGWKKLYQQYDESGKLIGLSEDGNKWIGLDDKTGLTAISKKYGDFTQKLVNHILNNEGTVTRAIVDEAFY